MMQSYQVWYSTFMYPSPPECRIFRNLLEHSRWKHRNHSPTPKQDFPYMNLILRTIPDLLVISRIPFGTPNNIRSLTHHSITTQQHRILKCVSLRFVNYADMIETLLRSITNRGIWKYIWLPQIIRLLCDRMKHLHTIPVPFVSR